MGFPNFNRDWPDAKLGSSSAEKSFADWMTAIVGDPVKARKIIEEGTADPMEAGGTRKLRDAKFAGQLISPAELSTFELLAEGLSIAEIARRRVVSPHTVRSQLKVVYSKLGAHNAPHAVALGVITGELDLSHVSSREPEGLP